MTVRVSPKGKNTFVAKLEQVFPHLEERFGVAQIGVFGSTAI